MDGIPLVDIPSPAERVLNLVMGVHLVPLVAMLVHEHAVTHADLVVDLSQGLVFHLIDLKDFLQYRDNELFSEDSRTNGCVHLEITTEVVTSVTPLHLDIEERIFVRVAVEAANANLLSFVPSLKKDTFLILLSVDSDGIVINSSELDRVLFNGSCHSRVSFYVWCC